MEEDGSSKEMQTEINTDGTTSEQSPEELRRSTVVMDLTIRRCLDVAVVWPCLVVVACYMLSAMWGRLVWPFWFPSAVFDQRIGHLISSMGIPLSIMPMSIYVFCRYHIVKLGDSHEEVQHLNKASLRVVGIGIVSMVGVAAVNISFYPVIHYIAAGVFFLCFAIDVALQMTIANCMDANSYQHLRGGGSKVFYFTGCVVIIAAIASLAGVATQSLAAMSIAELTFVFFIFLFYSQDYELLARCHMTFQLTQRHSPSDSKNMPVRANHPDL